MSEEAATFIIRNEHEECVIECVIDPTVKISGDTREDLIRAMEMFCKKESP